MHIFLFVDIIVVINETKVYKNVLYIKNINTLMEVKMGTKLIDRRIPEYTRGEEIFSMVLSIIGGALSVAVLVFCLIVSVMHKNVFAVVSSAIYGSSLIIMYCMSSLYHGLKKYIPKKVFQILTHCAVFMMTASTYMVILLGSIRQVNTAIAWTFFGIEWGIAVLAITFSSVDLEKNKILSIICYIVMSCAILPIYKFAIAAMGLEGFILFVIGIILYIMALVNYMFEKKVKYLHCFFHLMFLLGSAIQFISIISYCI